MAEKKTAKKIDKNMTIEEAFREIEDRISSLEDEDITLEDSFKEYQAGMKLIKFCHDAISEVEKKVQKITEDGELEDFE